MSDPVVTVRGTASLECPPDLATLSFTVHRAASSAAEVHDALAVAVAELGDQVERFRPALEQSSSGGLHVAPVFSSPKGARLTGYRRTAMTA